MLVLKYPYIFNQREVKGHFFSKHTFCGDSDSSINRIRTVAREGETYVQTQTKFEAIHNQNQASATLSIDSISHI